MAQSSYAVILGFDRFQDRTLPTLKCAQKDAHDLSALLTDPLIGAWPSPHVSLITNDVLRLPETLDECGERYQRLRDGRCHPSELTTADIETILFNQIVKHRTAQDVVLVYYAGHGYLAGDGAEAYLATPDVEIDHVLANPRAGLHMSYLYEQLFKKTPARLVVFILDCCHAGAFRPHSRCLDDNAVHSVVEDRFFEFEGRVAIVSCPKGIRSRESERQGNGVFTAFLLEGLRGAAAEYPSNEVTIGSLAAYVQSRCPLAQPPVYFGRSLRHVLCRPQVKEGGDTLASFLEFNDLGRGARVGRRAVPCVALANPLDEHLKHCDRMLAELGRDCVAEPGHILRALERALNAMLVFVCRLDGLQNVSIVGASQSRGTAQVDQVVRRVLENAHQLLVGPKEPLLSVRYGFSLDGPEGEHVVGVPLSIDRPREFLFVVSNNDDCRRGGETLGRVLATLYAVTNGFVAYDATRLESQLLDDLRMVFGHVPHAVYERRFSLFKGVLSRVEFSFEPVVCLGKRHVEIDSWEALARDPATSRVPSNLFKTAELWGARFTTELDIECLRKAVRTFSELWHSQRAGEKMDALSVNVYPETLYREAYRSEVRRLVLDEELVRSKRFVLEISEKQPLPNGGGWDDDRCVREFVDRLHFYTDELHIGFAIDDFGVGHSSVERLAKLELDHIKLDRDILLHPYPMITMKYVQDIVQRTHRHPSRIVVEGYDRGTRLTLKELFEMRMMYVQGHYIRQAAASVENLSADETSSLRKSLFSATSTGSS